MLNIFKSINASIIKFQIARSIDRIDPMFAQDRFPDFNPKLVKLALTNVLFDINQGVFDESDETEASMDQRVLDQIHHLSK